MSHFTVVVAVPEGGDLSEILEPYDENMRVPRYIEHTKAEAIAKERDEIIEYRDNGYYAEYVKDPVVYSAEKSNHVGHLNYLRTEFPEKLTHLDDEDWLYEQAMRWVEEEDVDEDGNITSTYNPKSKWDWWTIGGRWSGFFNATYLGMQQDVVFGGEYASFGDDGVDTLQVKDLRREHLRTPYAFVDLEGNWFEKGQMGWFGMSSNEQKQADWDQEYLKFLDSLDPETTLVMIDAHI